MTKNNISLLLDFLGPRTGVRRSVRNQRTRMISRLVKFMRIMNSIQKLVNISKAKLGMRPKGGVEEEVLLRTIYMQVSGED
jgi:hypothetical protein